ncbi:MAG: alpha/beta hydrolase [Acidimicrobiales bacterium]
MTPRAATYVLVHGAWHGPWAFEPLTRILDERGVSWIAPALPSSHDDGDGSADLAADAAVVVAAAVAAGPVVLVGHSYAGAVVTEAAPRLDVREIVYIAALVPRVGESATEASRRVRVRTQLDDAMRLEGAWLTLDPELAAVALYGHLAPSDAAAQVARLGRQTLASFRSPRQAADVEVPRRYLRCLEDQAIDPSLQDQMAMSCDTVIDLASDHSPFHSHPDVLADALFDEIRKG